MSFRECLKRRYRSCLITGLHADECDGAHIIPAKICMELNKNHTNGLDWHAIMQNPDNGLLLCKNLHWSFDGFLWTFDIFDLQIRTKSNQPVEYFLPLIVKNPRLKTTVKQYHKDDAGDLIYYQIYAESLPYLLIHYHIFILVNNPQQSNINRNQNLMINLYYRTLQNFKLDLNQFLEDLKKTKCVGADIKCEILTGIWDYSPVRDQFLVLYWGQSWTDRKWVARAELPDDICSDFEDNLSEIDDPSHKRRRILE